MYEMLNRLSALTLWCQLQVRTFPSRSIVTIALATILLGGHYSNVMAQPEASLQGTCLRLAPQAAALAELRDAGQSELELRVLVRRAGGPLMLGDIMTWMVSELYTSLRYVPPNEVTARVETMCKSNFN